MKIEMEFQGLKELMKAFEDAASERTSEQSTKRLLNRGNQS